MLFHNLKNSLVTLFNAQKNLSILTNLNMLHTQVLHSILSSYSYITVTVNYSYSYTNLSNCSSKLQIAHI